MSRSILIAVALVAALCLPAVASAVVPPKSCGTMTVKGKRYQIKADQMRCSRAKDYARDYLKSRDRPRGYRCRSYKGSKLKFRCERGSKTFFAIKR